MDDFHLLYKIGLTDWAIDEFQECLVTKVKAILITICFEIIRFLVLCLLRLALLRRLIIKIYKPKLI